jgi:hypothetical protein
MNGSVPAREPTASQSNLALTVAVGLATLFVGVLAGYFGRPLVTPQAAPATVVPAENGAATVPGEANPPSASNPSPQTLMDAVAAQTRHFKGDPNAPVTIVEFGDFL